MTIGIGETLRAARRERGLSLDDVASETRIRQRYLSALEDEEFASLGEDVYVKGFLRSYAKYLGVRPEPLLHEYQRSFGRDPDDVVALTASVSEARQPMPLPRAVRVVATAAAVVLLLGIVAVLGDGDRTTAEPPPLALDPTASPGSAAPAGPTAAPTAARTPTPTPGATTTAAPASGVEVRVLVSGGDSWLRVAVDGRVEVEGVQPDGTALEFSGEDEVVLRIGNAGAVQLVVDGENIGPAGASGEVVDRTYRAADAGDASG